MGTHYGVARNQPERGRGTPLSLCRLFGFGDRPHRVERACNSTSHGICDRKPDLDFFINAGKTVASLFNAETA
jgi:hypothetical protein